MVTPYRKGCRRTIRNYFRKMIADTRVMRHDGCMSESETAGQAPDAVAFLYRPATFGPEGTHEECWITRHDGARQIIVTVPAVYVNADLSYPGVVREVPVRRAVDGPQAEVSAKAFDAVVEIHVRDGWTLGDAVAYPTLTVRPVEPWESKPEDFDRPCSF
jgi:hypothetical protein